MDKRHLQVYERATLTVIRRSVVKQLCNAGNSSTLSYAFILLTWLHRCLVIVFCSMPRMTQRDFLSTCRNSRNICTPRWVDVSGWFQGCDVFCICVWTVSLAVLSYARRLLGVIGFCVFVSCRMCHVYVISCRECWTGTTFWVGLWKPWKRWGPKELTPWLISCLSLWNT